MFFFSSVNLSGYFMNHCLLLQSSKEFHHFPTCSVKNQLFILPLSPNFFHYDMQGLLKNSGYSSLSSWPCDSVDVGYVGFYMNLFQTEESRSILLPCGRKAVLYSIITVILMKFSLLTDNSCIRLIWGLLLHAELILVTFVNGSSWVRAHCFVR